MLVNAVHQWCYRRKLMWKYSYWHKFLPHWICNPQASFNSLATPIGQMFFVVFVRLFEQAEQRSFVPPIMMIERNFTCSNKKTNMNKNYIQRNSWTFGNPACQKIWEKSLVTYLFAPPKRKHCWTAPDPTLWACWGDVTMPPLLLWLSAHNSANAHDASVCWYR